MTARARFYIAAVILSGLVCLCWGIAHGDGSNPLGFLFWLGLALPASCLKIRLPGVTGTMSVLFLFLLGAVVELNLAEALLLGAVCVGAQSFWNAKTRPRAVHVSFSMAAIINAVAVTYLTYSIATVLPGSIRLLAASVVLFLANTVPIALVIAMTEHRSVRGIWARSYLWYFPYYLAGAGIVGAFHFVTQTLGWQAAILAFPIAWVIYRSYVLYLSQLQGERKRVEEEHAHAAEVEQLHARTLDALAAATRAGARLDAVFRASPLAMLTVDGEGAVSSWNRMAERIFRWTADEVTGRPLPVPAGCSEPIARGFAERTLQGEHIDGVELKQWRKDGSSFHAAIWTAALLSAPEADAAGISDTLITVADVSDRRALEERLRHSQKMEAIGQLAGGVAHDFNNLLTVINGFSSLLLDTVGGNPAAVSQVEEILGAGTRAAELVSQLLSFSRRQTIKPTTFEVNQFVREVQRLLVRVIGEHIELRTRLAPDAGWIHADRNQMESVLLNLASNARDAMPEGGVLTIGTERVEVRTDQPETGADLAPGTYVRLKIRDTGCGMDAHTRQHLFEPFYTTKERGKGTGLGLSSVYGNIEQNRGRIMVASEPGLGSEFSVYLPGVGPPDPPAPGVPGLTAPVHGTETILLVEDENSVRLMLREALVKAGYRVWEACNGADAISRWACQIDRVDLVVTDMVMPAMNGLKMSEELRKLRPGLNVVFMSGHAEEVIRTQGGSGEFEDMLQKPFVPVVLVRKVREVLDQPARRGNTAYPSLRASS